jgi:hypothetical protein
MRRQGIKTCHPSSEPHLLSFTRFLSDICSSRYPGSSEKRKLSTDAHDLNPTAPTSDDGLHHILKGVVQQKDDDMAAARAMIPFPKRSGFASHRLQPNPPIPTDAHTFFPHIAYPRTASSDLPMLLGPSYHASGASASSSSNGPPVSRPSVFRLPETPQRLHASTAQTFNLGILPEQQMLAGAEPTLASFMDINYGLYPGAPRF